jgi:hypothetical protein
MDAFPCIRRVGLLPFFLTALTVLAARPSAQEACLKGCGYPGYPGMVFTLGDGFVTKGGEVKVTHMGFLGQVYNNDGITPRKVGVPNYIGELSFIDPVTGGKKFLFRNQKDWITHENDSGKVISLGVFPKGAPIVFEYVNVDGKETSYKTFSRYSGDNIAGTYDFDADPILKPLAINGKPKPVSGGSWNWEGRNYNLWAVAASVPGTDEKQFHFEDADDRIFNDIVFRVSGVALTSESFKLQPPVHSFNKEANGNFEVRIANSSAVMNQGSRLYYTTDGSAPTVDSSGAPTGSTREYLSPLILTRTTTVKSLAWKKTLVGPGGNTTRYEPSDIVTETYAIPPIPRLQWSKPTAIPPGGPFTRSVSVTLTQAEGAKMYFRLCDPGEACEPPTTGNTSYTGTPFLVIGRKTLKVVAIQTSRDDSEVAEFAFSPSFKATDALYLDRNGDGRMDAVRILLEGAPAVLPPGVTVEDPLNPGGKRDAPVGALSWESAAHASLLVDLSAEPFNVGTGVVRNPTATFKAGGDGYPAAPFAIRDGAGPVALSATAEISLDSGSVQRLRVTFSEPLRDPGRTGALPYRIKRGGEDISGDLAVSSVKQIGEGAYEYVFSSAVFPIPGDSLKSTSLALDNAGNAGAMPGYLEVQGKRPSISSTLKVTGGGCSKGGSIAVPKPLLIPISVIAPGTPATAAGCAESDEAARCLDCATGEWKRSDPSRPDLPLAGPEIKVTTRAPFTFDLGFYSTLGVPVNRAKGEVTEAMLLGVAADPQGYRTVGLRWHPVSEKGAQAASGAYIVKGYIATRSGTARTMVMGIPVHTPSTSEPVLLRFGYLRR